jgi:hypothetical protein
MVDEIAICLALDKNFARETHIPKAYGDSVPLGFNGIILPPSPLYPADISVISINVGRRNPARAPLLLHNAFFGKKTRKYVKAGVWMKATNSPLYSTAFDQCLRLMMITSHESEVGDIERPAQRMICDKRAQWDRVRPTSRGFALALARVRRAAYCWQASSPDHATGAKPRSAVSPA